MSDFYVGYLPKSPAAIARHTRLVVVVLLLLAGAAATLFALTQHTLAPVGFEFGIERTIEGIVETTPYPALRVVRPGAVHDQSAYSYYPLVAPGKHGADLLVAGLQGKVVRLRGTLIYRENQTMVEVVPGSITNVSADNRQASSRQLLGSFTLSGEIVDSKCNFGVMNPGQGKVHKDCAVRCLSGGIPPAFVTYDFQGHPATLLLAAPGLTALPKAAFLAHVAQPVRLRGTVIKDGDELLFEVEPGSLSVLP